MNEGNQFSLKHGHTPKCPETGRPMKSPTYVSWSSMLDRVRKPQRNCSHFENGVGVHPRWDNRNGGSFANFLEDMGERPSTEYCLARVTSDGIHDVGNYEPGNCQWILKTENCKAAAAKTTA